jgi:excisionase family DNA binding protein
VTTGSGRDTCSVALVRQGDRRTVSAAGPHETTSRFGSGPGRADRGSGRRRDTPVAAQRKGSEAPSYLLPAEVAELLSVSPKTVSRWAKEGKLPFMKTLGGHRRYPEAQIRQLVDELRQEPTA